MAGPTSRALTTPTQAQLRYIVVLKHHGRHVLSLDGREGGCDVHLGLWLISHNVRLFTTVVLFKMVFQGIKLTV